MPRAVAPDARQANCVFGSAHSAHRSLGFDQIEMWRRRHRRATRGLHLFPQTIYAAKAKNESVIGLRRTKDEQGVHGVCSTDSRAPPLPLLILSAPEGGDGGADASGLFDGWSTAYPDGNEKQQL
jgi:hypothetical protein